MRSDSATLMVLDETWTAPFPRLARMPPLPKTTLSSAASSANIVITISPPHTACTD